MDKMASTIIRKAIVRNKNAFKYCIKQCIVLESPFLLYTLYLSFWFSIMTPHHNNEKQMATKMATIFII